MSLLAVYSFILLLRTTFSFFPLHIDTSRPFKWGYSENHLSSSENHLLFFSLHIDTSRPSKWGYSENHLLFFFFLLYI